MGTVVDSKHKQDLSEEDIKQNYITPAIEAKWGKGTFLMEYAITDGKINIRGNKPFREKPKKADYVLFMNKGEIYYPLAVVEAKDWNHGISDGMQQAKAYAQMLDVKFAYSSNGQGFDEYDFFTGKESILGMDELPTLSELINRFYREGKVTPQERDMICQPYYTDANTYPPRYYQRNAINRCVNAVAKGQKRLLLVMATGTGKTYCAFQIIYRLLQQGCVKKVLYLADRNILVDQSIAQDFAPLVKIIHKVNYTKDSKNNGVTAYQIYFALYQQLIGEHEEERFRNLFTPDFFDLIVVDECHRGSAKEESQWRCILDYFNASIQLGMTATPKETKYASNISYFGEPVYTYSLNNGIEDGYLAPFKVIQVKTNIGDGWRPTKGQKDIYGHIIEDRLYYNNDYDYNIILEDRIRQVADDITAYLKSTDRMAKTIVFCANEDHAERMRIALANTNADMCQKNPDYVVRITGSDTYGKDKLDAFISVGEAYPVIATTSKLLSTGVDCKLVKVIVLDEWITSMTEFKQIIGRGTRLRVDKDKTHFVVIDFRNISALFADPDWDGPIIIDPDFPPKPPVGPDPIKPPIDPPDPPLPPPPDTYKPVVDKDGCTVQILQRVVSTYDPSGKLLRQENIIDYTKRNILGQYASLRDFIHGWTKSQKKVAVSDALKGVGIDLAALKHDMAMDDVDDFDFICYVAYGQKPMTRQERAKSVREGTFFTKYGDKAKEVLEALLLRYMNDGIYEIEDRNVLGLPEFKKIGSKGYIARQFGGKKGYDDMVKEMEAAIYGGHKE